MTSVLLDSRAPGSTGWTATRGRSSLRVIGLLEGERLILQFRPEQSELSVDEDGSHSLPSVEYIKIFHQTTIQRNGARGVFADLI